MKETRELQYYTLTSLAGHGFSPQRGLLTFSQFVNRLRHGQRHIRERTVAVSSREASTSMG